MQMEKKSWGKKIAQGCHCHSLSVCTRRFSHKAYPMQGEDSIVLVWLSFTMLLCLSPFQWPKAKLTSLFQKSCVTSGNPVLPFNQPNCPSYASFIWPRVIRTKVVKATLKATITPKRRYLPLTLERLYVKRPTNTLKFKILIPLVFSAIWFITFLCTWSRFFKSFLLLCVYE